MLSAGQLQDTIRYCQCLINCGQHHRATQHLKESHHLSACPSLRYLLATCYAEQKAWEEVLELLRVPTGVSGQSTLDQNPPDSDMLGDVSSGIQVLMGRAHEALGNIADATSCYKQAVTTDVFCAEALERLYELHALTAEDEVKLLDTLLYKDQCHCTEEKQLVMYLYQSKCHHRQVTPDCTTSDPLYPLSASVDMLCSQAGHMLQSRRLDQCHAITSKVLLREPLHPHAVLLHVACCVSKGLAKELYSLGHELVQLCPSSELTWYTVGCYYLTTKKHIEARRYLVKTLTHSPHFSPAHIAFGTSFAQEGEHDQAIAAFSNAARYLQGSHVALLYLSREYFVSGSTTVAFSFLKNALAVSCNDPFVLYEAGVALAITGYTGYMAKAEHFFTQAIALLRSSDHHGTLSYWEPLYNSLGYVLRKQGKYGPALDAHMLALQVDPLQPLTCTCIAFVYLLLEEFQSCIQYCQRSLLLKREDQFTVEVMQLAVDQLTTCVLESGSSLS